MNLSQQYECESKCKILISQALWSRSVTWTTTSTTAQYTASISTPGTQSTWANTPMWWEVENFYKEWLFNCCWTQIESFKPLLPLLRQRFQLRSSFREVAQVKDRSWLLVISDCRISLMSDLWCQVLTGYLVVNCKFMHILEVSHWAGNVLSKKQLPFSFRWTKDSFLSS